MKNFRRPFWLYLWRSVDQLLPLWDAGACRWDGLWYTLVPDNGGSARKPNRALLEIERLEKRWLMDAGNGFTVFSVAMGDLFAGRRALAAGKNADGSAGDVYTTDGTWLYDVSSGQSVRTPGGYPIGGDLAAMGTNICYPINQVGDANHPLIGCVSNGLSGITTIPLSTSNTPFTVNRLGSGPDGSLWFTGTGAYNQSQDAVGYVTGSSAVEYLLGAPGSGGNYSPQDITAGPDGNLWFTNFFDSTIGRITPGGSLTTYGYLNGGNPSDITAGADGNLWFTEVNGTGDRVGRISTTGVITEFQFNSEPVKESVLVMSPSE